MKTQLGVPAPAEELFASELFRRRRRYAEALGRRWFVLSSKHGLLRPETVVEPYDLPLARRPVAYRRAWGEHVIAGLAGELGPLAGVVVEVHAGAAHVDPLRGPLARRGAALRAPLDGLTQGRHLAWYAGPGRDQRGRPARAGCGAKGTPRVPDVRDHGRTGGTMSDLRVDTAALRAAARQLREAAAFADGVRDRGGRLRELAPSAAGDAARATEGFLREWSYGLELIGHDAEALAGALESAAAAFEAVESQLAEGLR